MEQLLTPQQVAAALQVSRKTITDWIYHKKITCIKVGGLVRFRQSHIDAFLKESYTEAQHLPKPARKRGRPKKRHAHAYLIELSRPRPVYNTGVGACKGVD